MKNPLNNLARFGRKVYSGISQKNRLVLLIVLGGVGITVLMLASAPQHNTTVVEEAVWPITTLVVEPESLSPELKLFGKIENPNHAQLTAAVTATVNALNVIEGEFVRAGDILVVLDDADESLRLQRRYADLVDAQSQLEQTARRHKTDRAILEHMRQLFALIKSKAERLETLRLRNLVATEQLENIRQEVARQAIQLEQQQLAVDNHPQLLAMATSAVQRSESAHAEQELRLQRTRIRAPFDGRVSSVSVAVGDRISEGKVAISVYDLDNLRVRAAIPGTVTAELKQALASGADVRAHIAVGDQFISLKLLQMAAQVRRGRSGVDGLFQFDSGGNFLELGLAVDMTVILPAIEQVVAVPIQSLYGNNRIYTVKEGRLRGVTVVNVGQRLDKTGNFQTLVRSPELSPGSHVLTTTLPKASSGLRVEIVKSQELLGEATLGTVNQII